MIFVSIVTILAEQELMVLKILFFQNPNGEVVLSNASAQAIQKAQAAFAGAAEALGVADEADVQALVDEVRYGREG